MEHSTSDKNPAEFGIGERIEVHDPDDHADPHDHLAQPLAELVDLLSERVFSSSSRASMTARWIFPISAFIPVRTTSALHMPFAIVVPAKSMLTFSERPASTVVQTSGF